MMRKVLRAVFIAAAFSFLLVGLLGSAVAQKPNKKARNLATEGDRFYNSRDYKNALLKYGEAISIAPVFPKVRFYKGNAHYKLGEYSAAIRELDMALSQGFSPLEVVTVRMEAYLGDGKYDMALNDVKRAIALSPNTAYYHAFLGRLELIAGEFPRAVDSLKRSIALGDRSADVHYLLAVAYGGSGDIAAQGTYAAEALRLATANAGEAWFLVGDSQHRRKMYQEAVQSFNNSINAFKNDINTGRTTAQTEDDLYRTYLDLAEVYRNLNRFDDAIETAQEALSLRPNDGTIHTNLAWYYSLSGQTANAISAGRKAVSLSGSNYVAHTNLCRAYIDEGEYFYRSTNPAESAKARNSFNQALASCNQALKLEPEDGETNYYLGRTYFFLDNSALSDSHYRKSVPRLEKFTADNPNYSDGFYLLGNAYFATKQNQKAIEAYRRCLDISPNFARVRYNLGFVLVQEKQWDRARAEQAVLKGQDKDLADRLLKVITDNAPKN